MYNEEQKTKFIKSYTNSIYTARTATTIFNKFQEHEEEWGADLCTRTAEELQPIINELVGLRSKSKWMTLSILRRYVKWCMVMKVPGACDGMANVEVGDLEKMRRQMVASPMHLQTCLDKLYVPEREETIDDIYRCYFWLAYSGVKEQDVLSIKSSDLDFEQMRIKYNDTTLPIYRESLPALKNVATLTSFVYFHPLYSKLIRRDRVPGDEIMRGVKSSTRIASIRAAISGKIEEAKSKGIQAQQLSFRRIKLSGLFYRMYEREQVGIPVSFFTEVLEFVGGKANVEDPSNKRYQKQVERYYKEDYERWKLAFQK